MSFIVLVEQTAPETPSTNQVVVYPKSDGRVYSKDDTGTERAISASAASTTDNAVARFDGAAGALQNSGVIIDDSNNITGVSTLTASSLIARNSGVNTTVVSFDDGTSRFTVLPNLGAGALNPISQAGDVGVFVDDSAQDTGKMVIGGWATSSFGIRLDNVAKTIALASAIADTLVLNAGRIFIGTTSPATGFSNAGDITAAATNAIKSRSTFSAWALHDRDGTLVRSLNVSSVTKNSGGNFTGNITSGVMADGSYSFKFATTQVGYNTGMIAATIYQDNNTAPTATALRYQTAGSATGTASEPYGNTFMGVLP